MKAAVFDGVPDLLGIVDVLVYDMNLFIFFRCVAMSLNRFRKHVKCMTCNRSIYPLTHTYE